MGTIGIADSKPFVEAVVSVGEGLGDVEAKRSKPGLTDRHHERFDALHAVGEIPEAYAHELRTGEVERDDSHIARGYRHLTAAAIEPR